MYTIIEHTADIGIHVVAGDIEEFFTDAAAGMFSLMLDPVGRGPSTAPSCADGWPARETVVLSGPCLSDLLIDWLNELLYLFERKKMIYEGAVFDHLHETSLQALVTGCRFRGQIPGSEIKAATYHFIEQSPEGVFDATVYFDV